MFCTYGSLWHKNCLLKTHPAYWIFADWWTKRNKHHLQSSRAHRFCTGKNICSNWISHKFHVSFTVIHQLPPPVLKLLVVNTLFLITNLFAKNADRFSKVWPPHGISAWRQSKAAWYNELQENYGWCFSKEACNYSWLTIIIRIFNKERVLALREW